jgi:hypothetical protein
MGLDERNYFFRSDKMVMYYLHVAGLKFSVISRLFTGYLWLKLMGCMWLLGGSCDGGFVWAWCFSKPLERRKVHGWGG